MEQKKLWGLTGEVAEDEATGAFGEARIARPGNEGRTAVYVGTGASRADGL
jgi:hypothetical protein